MRFNYCQFDCRYLVPNKYDKSTLCCGKLTMKQHANLEKNSITDCPAYKPNLIRGALSLRIVRWNMTFDRSKCAICKEPIQVTDFIICSNCKAIELRRRSEYFTNRDKVRKWRSLDSFVGRTKKYGVMASVKIATLDITNAVLEGEKWQKQKRIKS